MGAPAVFGDAHTGHVAVVPEPRTSKLDAAVLRAQSKQALVGLGWKPAVAEAAVAAALGTLGSAVPLEQLIFEALRRCQPPSSIVTVRG